MNSLLSVPRESLIFHVLEPEIQDRTIRLRYQISGSAEPINFTEVIVLPAGPMAIYEAEAFRRVARLLAMAASLSYYKSCIPATVAVSGGLTSQEREFFSTLITNGLAEFAYRNNRPEALRPSIEAPERAPVVLKDQEPEHPSRALVAVGGGKDSIVTLEAVRRLPIATTLFSVNEYAPIRATVEESGLDALVASRKLDPLLFELNAQGALNGHVPVTAINSLIGCLIAMRLGYDAVVFSNEASSSSGNVAWEGVDVNHQWSKGIEFERALRSLLSGIPVTYFSFLRPLTELAITRQFANLTDYHPVFTSCNRAFHLDESKRRLWCGDCPKCHFVFLCLAPFLPKDELLSIFGGRNLLDDPRQHEGFLELLNADGRMKPFECVGEAGECRAALTLLSKQPNWKDCEFFELPLVQACFVDDLAIASALEFRDEHFLPQVFERAAREIL